MLFKVFVASHVGGELVYVVMEDDVRIVLGELGDSIYLFCHLAFHKEPRVHVEVLAKLISRHACLLQNVNKLPTAAVKSLHPSMCMAVHCSILLHPQLPWYHESAHYWELRDQV